MPQPAESSDGSAVARWAAHEKIGSTAGGNGPRKSANERSSSKASSAYTHAASFPDGLTTVSFTPALYDTFAVITRRAAHLSPGVRELIIDLEAHMQAVASDFDRSR
jgi:hypothetical protein